MSSTLQDHERTWLEELKRRLEAGLPIDRREMMVQLREKLPQGFRPNSVASQLRHENGPSVLGLTLLESAEDLLKDVERAIRYVRDCLISQPHLQTITAEQMADDMGWPVARSQILLALMSSVGNFASGVGQLPEGQFGYWQIAVTGDDTLAEFLTFEGLGRALASRSEAPAAPPVSLPRVSPSVSTGTRLGTAFILMNMDPKDPSLLDVLNAIKRVCGSFDLDASRIDDIEHQDRITDQVLGLIRSSDLLIADLSGERPNVYYEVGFAHALGKRPILYRKSGTRLHFDLSVHNVPEYANVTELAAKLSRRLEAVLGRSARA